MDALHAPNAERENTLLNFAALTPALTALTLSGLTGQAVTDTEKAALGNVSWEDLCELAKHHDLLPLLDAGVTASGLQPPPEVRAALRKAARVAEIRSDRAWEELTPVIRAFDRAGISLLLLKGAQLAKRYYPTPGLRPFGDLDMVVRAEDREAGAELLLSLGYRNADDQLGAGKAWCVENHFHWNFTRERSFPIELHWSLTFPESAVPLDLQDLWNRSRVIGDAEGRFRVLHPDDELLFLAAHITRHCFKLPLRSHIDIAAILLRSPDLDWEALWQRAVMLGVTVDLLAVLGAGHRLGLFALPPDMAERVQDGARTDFDLPFLVRYMVECPFVTAPERWLEAQNAPNRRTALSAAWRTVFPKYTHLWTPQVEKQASHRPALVYGLAWSRRAGRLLGHLRNLPKLVSDFRTTGRMHRMFGDRRRRRHSSLR